MAQPRAIGPEGVGPSVVIDREALIVARGDVGNQAARDDWRRCVVILETVHAQGPVRSLVDSAHNEQSAPKPTTQPSPHRVSVPNQRQAPRRHLQAVNSKESVSISKTVGLVAPITSTVGVPVSMRLCCSPTATCLITFVSGRETSLAVWQFSSLPWPSLPCCPARPQI